ncbi:hypothetical protein BJY01DRAFT_238849 [Aspergillus pseudoustus]|uniref:Xylanolytic transcriptional activator regulatory domain-containing protein n=1 Tax=Aspergillus pseudoustus TaxID=1810923 RepID=A0ABR4J5V8_9EURO
MCQAIPADREVAEIFATRSRWWSTKRRSFGLAWGDGGDRTLTHFATHAVLSENPSLLGNLLLCFALSTGDFGRYLVPVERWILSDALHCSTVYDFQCLMGLGVCFLSDMQPRRAWMVYRNANALLQLNGIHRSQQRSQSLDLIFWELFGADRWVSMLIGLPYSIPDTLCYLPILPIDRSDPCTFHHRHMILLSGRVIDCLQSPSGLSRSAIIKVDEDINRVTAQLPPNYVDMTHIAACPEPDERIARLYRVAELNQLKTLLYLPLFLQQCDPGQHQQPEDPLAHYGRTACVGSARSLLEAYLALYDIDPAAAAVDNCMKLTSFTAFSAAVVLFLNILAQAHSNTEGVADWSSVLGADMASIYRTASAFEASSEGRPSSLCGQCQTALTDLISASQTLGRGESRQIRVPYFGVVKMVRSENRDSVTSNDQPVDTELQQSPPLFRDPVRTTILAAGDDTELFPALTVSDDLFFSYYGPWGCDNQARHYEAEEGKAPSVLRIVRTLLVRRPGTLRYVEAPSNGRGKLPCATLFIGFLFQGRYFVQTVAS